MGAPEVAATPAADTPEAAALQADFFAKLKGHGREIPADRLAGVLAVHRELSRMAALLRQPRPAQSEPAQNFCVARTLAGAQSE